MKKLWWGMLLAFSLLGAGSTNEIESADRAGVTVSFRIDDDVANKFYCENPAWSWTEDAIYIMPTDQDIRDFLRFYRWRREGLPFHDEAWDCDNISREAKHWADVWAYRYYGRSSASIAVGRAFVHMVGDIRDIWPGYVDVDFYHVLNVILRADGQWLFFEPQNGKLVPIEGFIYERTIEVLRIEI